MTCTEADGCARLLGGKNSRKKVFPERGECQDSLCGFKSVCSCSSDGLLGSCVLTRVWSQLFDMG